MNRKARRFQAKEMSPVPAGGGTDRPRTPPPGDLFLDAVERDAKGRPPFQIPIPAHFRNEPALAYLIEEETRWSGYEAPLRAFLAAHLEAGDGFLDIGAHWGLFAAVAATRHPGEISVLAVEPDPLNLQAAQNLITVNRLGGSIELVAAAAGAAAGTAPLVANSSMGHSLHGHGLKGLGPAALDQAARLGVAVLPLDLLLAERPNLAGRRLIIKIDVEGYEPEVLAGAAGILASGRVRAVILEKGLAFATGERAEALALALAALEAAGFRLMRSACQLMGGALTPFIASKEEGNILALAPDLVPLAGYPVAFRGLRPVPEPFRIDPAPAERARITAALIACAGSDGARWADIRTIPAGADARADAAAAWIGSPTPDGPADLLDLGAGMMRLRPLLAPGWRYRPLDLVARAPDTLLRDLNRRAALPSAGLTLALQVLEYIHDRAALLAEIAAPRLICSWDADGDVAARRAAGYVTPPDRAGFEACLATAGWQIVRSRDIESRDAAPLRLYDCRRLA